MSNRAIFLDRDGTINQDKGYLYKISDFEFIRGSIEGMKLLYEAGFKLIMITNQSGIARGMYTEKDYWALNSWLLDQISSNGIKVEASYFCPHLPKAIIPEYRQTCDCRKPSTGLFHKAVNEHDIDLDSSFAIGDRLRDLAICSESGCRGYLVGTTEGDEIIGSVLAGNYLNISYASGIKQAALSILG